jgi:hypothetical protein
VPQEAEPSFTATAINAGASGSGIGSSIEQHDVKRRRVRPKFWGLVDYLRDTKKLGWDRVYTNLSRSLECKMA